MALIRYNNPFNDFTPVTFGSVLDKFFNENPAQLNGRVDSFIPQVDVAETEKRFEISVAVPGLKKEDIRINLEEGKLTISGERKFEKEEKGKNFLTRETRYGTFSRSFFLPDNVDAEKIEANYNEGILNVFVPKDEKKVLKKNIEVR